MAAFFGAKETTIVSEGRGKTSSADGELWRHSLSVVGVLSRAIREANLPDFITGGIEYLELDVVSELKEQIPSLGVETGIRHGFILQLFLQLFYCVNWRR